MRHRANRDLLDCSPVTCLLIQAIKAIGRGAAGKDIAAKVAARLSNEEVEALYDETRNSTAWVFGFAKNVKEAKGC